MYSARHHDIAISIPMDAVREPFAIRRSAVDAENRKRGICVQGDALPRKIIEPHTGFAGVSRKEDCRVLTNESYFAEALQNFPADSAGKNLQIVLSAQVNFGTGGPPKVLAGDVCQSRRRGSQRERTIVVCRRCQAMPFDVDFWKQWEGQNIDSVFPLKRCIGGESRGGVFATEFEGRPAAIKLVTGTPEAVEGLIGLWKQSEILSHVALIKALAHGKSSVGDRPCAYFVMNLADDNLAEVLAERALTPDEARDLLHPVLDVLEFLHENGFAHGGLKPPNLLAFGDQLKVSSDSLVRGGDPAIDCKALGTLLESVLGANLPEPFAAIIRNCSTPDPAARWNLARIKAHLRGDPLPAEPSKSNGRWWGLAAAAVVLIGAFAFWPSAVDVPAGDPAPQELAPAASDGKKGPAEAKGDKASKQPKAKAGPAPKVTPVGPMAGDGRLREDSRPTTVAGITQVLPDIPQAARKTISGQVRVNVRVRVDGAGNVSQATPEPPPVSKYFTDRALAAARSWKFPAGSAPQTWVLRFELTREQTLVSPARVVN